MGDTSDTDELYSIYGNIGNLQITTIRKICRDRLMPYSGFTIKRYLENGADRCDTAADRIVELDGSDEAVRKLRECAAIFRYMMDRPRDVRKAVESAYEGEFSKSSGQSNADYRPRIECYYERNPETRACWGCPVPRRVFEKFQRSFEEANQELGGLKEADIRR